MCDDILFGHDFVPVGTLFFINSSFQVLKYVSTNRKFLIIQFDVHIFEHLYMQIYTEIEM